jgi:histidyl-tRNA synthetase
MRLSAPRGTRDIKDREALAFRELEAAALESFRRYGYEEIRTPVFETRELFRRAVGETTDIVEKEMFDFSDRGGRELSLRPEGTAGVVRSYLEHSMDKTGGIKKLFYMGPMFRAERPQAGRYREFWQIGAEFFGNPSPQADAETLLLIRDILSGFGLKEFAFHLNSLGCPDCRPAYRNALTTYLEARRASLCEDCKRRLDKNPLRCLDCKTDGPSLTDAPRTADHLCEACRAHDKELDDLLRSVEFSFVKDPRLVRGLDYYTRTVFEVKAGGLGAQDALGAGGRYDGLVKQMGGPDTPAIGFALGVDRVCRSRHGDALDQAVPTDPARRIFVALAGVGTGETGFKILRDLRAAGLTVEIGAPEKSLKAQLRWADGWGAGRVVIVGEEELKRDAVLLKNLSDHSQKEIRLSTLQEGLSL